MVIFPEQAGGQRKLEPVHDWTTLGRKDDITLVHADGRTVARGSVDTVAPDGSVLWIIHYDGRGRTMVLPDDDIIVHRHSSAG